MAVHLPNEISFTGGRLTSILLHSIALCDFVCVHEAHAAFRRRLQALEAYEEQMQRREEEIDVFECALLIAKHAHPDLVRRTSPPAWVRWVTWALMVNYSWIIVA